MDLIRNDLLKFRRSHIWAVVVLVPLIAVAIGAGNYSANSSTLTAGWSSYFSQIMLFYGLIFMAAGVAICAAAAWRVEHRGHNWHSLLTSTRSAGSIAASKIAAISIIVIAMHAVLLILTFVGGLLLNIPDTPSEELAVAALLAIAPAIAVASWQSLLSMVIRNFAAPIAIALAASIVSFGALASGAHAAKFVLPPALLSDTLWLGSSAVAAAGTLDASTVGSVAGASAVLAALGWMAATVYLQNTDARL